MNFVFIVMGSIRLATPEEPESLPDEHDAIGVDSGPDRRRKPRKENQGGRDGAEGRDVFGA